jgi:RimJ/RimL family protein N-acetyltransferase
VLNDIVLLLREITNDDLDVLFEHWTDTEAIRMAAFVPADQHDRSTFEARWARILGDESTTNKAIELDGALVGTISSFDNDGRREVTYWIGREHWGKGIATRALREFLELEAARPLYGAAAKDNAGSIRVLEKCGFRLVGSGRAFAHGRGEEIDEVVLRLDA